MNSKTLSADGYSCLRKYFLLSLLAGIILLLTSCKSKPEPYSIIEFAGEEGLFNNYSKSFFSTFYEPDSLNPAALIASSGDMIVCGDYIFIYSDTSSDNRFFFTQTDEGLYVNGKISTISIPDNESLIPWFEKMNEKDFSALQCVRLTSDMPESYLPYLSKLAEIKPDAGLLFEGDFADMTRLLKIFRPRFIAAPDLFEKDFGLLRDVAGLEILVAPLADSVITDPLPPLPGLKQLILTELDKDLVLPDNFLINNKMIERILIQKPGTFDFSVLKPLVNLKELEVRESDSFLNINMINDLRNLEVLLLGDNKPDFDITQIRLPSLRWIAFFGNVPQERFNSFIGSHPGLEVIELITNDTISSLKALTGLSKLYGLTVTDTVTDISSIKTLKNLKYLSLPVDFLDDPIQKTELQRSLPDTRIAANQGMCLGSGWLLLLVPLVLIFRFINRKGKNI